MTPTKTPLKGKQKRTYVLSADVVERLEAKIAPGKRGVAVDEAIAHWLEEQRLKELRARVLEGLNDPENEALALETEREWTHLSDELWARLPDEEWPEPAIVWPNGLKAERQKHGDKPDA